MRIGLKSSLSGPKALEAEEALGCRMLKARIWIEDSRDSGSLVLPEVFLLQLPRQTPFKKSVKA